MKITTRNGLLVALQTVIVGMAFLWKNALGFHEFPNPLYANWTPRHYYDTIWPDWRIGGDDYFTLTYITRSVTVAVCVITLILMLMQLFSNGERKNWKLIVITSGLESVLYIVSMLVVFGASLPSRLYYVTGVVSLPFYLQTMLVIAKMFIAIISYRFFEKNGYTEESAKVSAVSGNADELKKYKDLLDSGVITQEEFDTKKKQLLDL